MNEQRKINIILGIIGIGTICLLLITIIFLTIWINSLYFFPLPSGEIEFKVSSYNEDLWNKTVGTTIYPTDLFGGQSDQYNAQRKYLLKNYEDDKVDIFDLAEILQDKTYNDFEKDLLRYSLELSGRWDVWMVYRNIWDFSISDFGINPDIVNEKIPIFKHPDVLLEVLNEFKKIDNTYNATKLIYQLVIKGIPIARPVDTFLNSMKEILNPNDVQVNNVQLNITLKGKEEYRVTADYSLINGNIDYLRFRNQSNSIFYEMLIPYGEGLVVPGYELSIISFIFLFLIFGIIYTKYKKIELK